MSSSKKEKNEFASRSRDTAKYFFLDGLQKDFVFAEGAEDHGSPISVVLSYKTSKIFDVLSFSHPKISSYIRLFYKIYSKFFLFLNTEMKYIASEALNVEFVYNNYFLRSKDPIYDRNVL